MVIQWSYNGHTMVIHTHGDGVDEYLTSLDASVLGILGIPNLSS
jgi:hypothetical protein